MPFALKLKVGVELRRLQNEGENLAVGQKFLKIDLRQAYHQLEMEEDSKKYFIINTLAAPHWSSVRRNV